ncbi:uncharacterized protein A4U43_C02F17120 [Asparagus officinalis]|uniref:Uncharacterized protein n=1 Tax=Asparagus officinalis TaxID=4686 RepID=A0A5P1FJQ3_ASPOF|nr:uncharacterized protein A4U43_C02F17120 [Asparagus officinalis]
MGKYTVDTHQPIRLEDIEEVMEDGNETNDMMEDMDMIGRNDSISSRGTSIQSSTRGPSGSTSQGSKVKNKIKSGNKIKDLQLEMISKRDTGICGVSEVMLMKHQGENERARKIIKKLGKLHSFKQQDLDKACDFLMEHSSIVTGFLMRSHEQKMFYSELKSLEVDAIYDKLTQLVFLTLGLGHVVMLSWHARSSIIPSGDLFSNLLFVRRSEAPFYTYAVEREFNPKSWVVFLNPIST